MVYLCNNGDVTMKRQFTGHAMHSSYQCIELVVVFVIGIMMLMCRRDDTNTKQGYQGEKLQNDLN